MVERKTRQVVRRLNHSVNFPAKANTIKKVLIILPRNLQLLDMASEFVQGLRKTYPGWRIELFDVDKLTKADLNRIKLPRAEILQKLKRAQYHLVLDLNEKFDQLASFITLMTEAPYRLHLQAESSIYFNIYYQPHKTDEPDEVQNHYEPLLAYLKNLFVRSDEVMEEM